MNTNSNSYTIIYASVMVVIVAFLLAFVSSSPFIYINYFLPAILCDVHADTR